MLLNISIEKQLRIVYYIYIRFRVINNKNDKILDKKP